MSSPPAHDTWHILRTTHAHSLMCMPQPTQSMAAAPFTGVCSLILMSATRIARPVKKSPVPQWPCALCNASQHTALVWRGALHPDRAPAPLVHRKRASRNSSCLKLKVSCVSLTCAAVLVHVLSLADTLCMIAVLRACFHGCCNYFDTRGFRHARVPKASTSLFLHVALQSRSV